MNNKPAPATAGLPPMTREMVAQWEAELDDFVVDIQSRLHHIATSITDVDDGPATSLEQITTTSDVAPASESLPSVEDQPIVPSVVKTNEAVTESDDANDRLQAIKLKLAARLQGEST